MKEFIKRMFGVGKGKEIHACGMTDIGLRRENNEDCFLVRPDRSVFIVADGMGGHRAGETASAEAVKALDAFFTSDLIERMKMDPTCVEQLMADAFRDMNRGIYEMSRTNLDYRGMGCALITALIAGGSLHTCHVGDVRCYTCSRSDIRQLTNDHTEVAEMVRSGLMTPEEARNSGLRSILTQAIGQPTPVTPEYHSYELKDDERVLLCSDGLWDMLPDSKIHTIVNGKRKISEICRELIAEANAAGGKDNITVVVFEKYEEPS
jgi:serine/threonine protein phosphatase PrpC